jgi:hypothetical protein
MENPTLDDALDDALDEALTFQQKYEIPLQVQWEDAPITVQYAGCGTHQVTMSGQIDLEQARHLYAALGALPGIKEN